MIKLSFSTLMRIATLMAACVLVGCGGASSTVNPLTPTRIIAFGDQLSAVDSSGRGTYTVYLTDTNTTVASRLAAIYGLTMSICEYATVNCVVSSGTAISYAEGATTTTARVTVPAQIKAYLENNTPGGSDLFIITAGTNDIASAALTNDTSTIALAATNLTTAIQTLTTAGAQYVLVMQPLNVARTPPFLASNGVRSAGANASYNSYAQALSYDTGTACQSFSCLLSTKLNAAYPATSSHQPILLADLMSYFNLITGTTNTGSANTFSSYGVTNPDLNVCSSITVPATSICSLATTSTNQYTSTSWDYTSSVFAYNYYLTPFAHRLLADYIYNYNFYRAGWR